MRHAFSAGAELHQAARKLVGAEGRDIGNREALAGDEFLLGQYAIQPARGVAEFLALRRAKVRKLRLLQRRKTGMRMADAVARDEEQVQLDAAVRHLDESALLEVLAHQIRLRLQALDIR